LVSSSFCPRKVNQASIGGAAIGDDSTPGFDAGGDDGVDDAPEMVYN